MKTVLSVVTTAMTAVLCSTSLAEGHAISAVKIPTGGYFDTGFEPKTNPKVTIAMRRDAEGTLDVFGTQGRKAGCFILNDENGYYYLRYGTASNNGSWGSATTVGGTAKIVCDSTLYVNGKEVKTATLAGTGDFSSGVQPMCFPGRDYPKGMSVSLFVLEDDGKVVRDLRPWCENGTNGFVDVANGNTFYAMKGVDAKQAEETDFATPVNSVWTGLGGDGKWSNAANWKDGEKPTGRTIDTVTIDIGDTSTEVVNDIEGVMLSSFLILGTNNKTVTVSGKPIRLKGSTALGTKVFDCRCSLVQNADIVFDCTGTIDFCGPSTVVNGDISVVGSNKLKIIGRPVNAKSNGVDWSDYPGLIGNSVSITLNGDVGGDEATIYLNTGKNGNGTHPYFYGNVTCAKLLIATETRPCVPHFCKSGNRVGMLAFQGSTSNWETDNAMCEETVIDLGKRTDSSYVWKSQVVFGTGTEQVANRVEGQLPPADGSGQYNLMVGGTDGTTDNAATLRLRGTANAVCHTRVCDALSLVWDPTGDFTQDFESRVHPTKGALDVRRGTLRTSGTNTFLNVPKVTVRKNATLEIASTNDVWAAFDALSQLVLEEGARLVVADAAVNPFKANSVGVTIAKDAKIVVPAGCTVQVGRLAYKDVEVEAKEYVEEEWLEGGGSVNVSGTVNVTKKVWWLPTSGAWEEAKNWLGRAVPTTSDDVALTANGTYELTYSAATAKPKSLELANASGTVTLNIDGDVTWGTGAFTIGPGAKVCVPKGSSLTFAGSPTVKITSGELAVEGTLAASDFSGTFDVYGSESATGRVTVTSGVVAWAVHDNNVDRQIGLFPCAEMTLTNSVFRQTRTDGASTSPRLRGGRLLVQDSAYGESVKAGNFTFGSGETVFSGTSTLTNSVGNPSIYVVASAAGETARLSFRDDARLSGWNFFDTVCVGRSSAVTAPDNTKAVLDLDSDVKQTTAYGTAAYSFTAGKPLGDGTINIRSGWLNPGPRGLFLGAAEGSCYSRSPQSGGKGTLNMSGGALTLQSTAVSEGFILGLIVGDGAPVAASAYETYTPWEGRYNQTGGVVTNNCNLLVGGARSFGWFTKTDGVYRQGSAGYPFIVGAAGGTGECLLGGGMTEIMSHVFVGGVFTNEIPVWASSTNWLARYGWPVDNHTAVGTLTVTGGTVTIGSTTTPRTLGVGFDGTGTLAVGGSLADITLNGDLVLSNTTETATSSTLKFKLDATGVAPIKVSGKVVNTPGTKLVVDVGDTQAKRKNRRLIQCANWEGPAITDVTFVGERAGEASLRSDALGLYVGLSNGGTVLVR